MAVVSRVATLVLSGATGSRTWVATAATQDTAAGSSVVVTCTMTTSGAAPPAQADTLTLECYIDNGASLIHSFSLTPGSASQTATFFFTNTGLTGGASRCGTVRLTMHAINTTGGVGSTYNVDSDLTNNTPPTGFTVTQHDQGWIRGTTTSTTTLPSTGTLAYGTTLTATTVLGATPYQSQTVKVALSPTLSAVTSGSSSTTTFTTALGSVDNRFPAAATSETSATTFPNATLGTSSPWTTATLTETTRTVDPRFTKTGLLQVNDNAWGTPPLSKDVPLHQRLTADLGFVSMRYQDANGNGVNGLSVSHTLQDNGALTTAITWSDTTATEGGDVGWTNTLQPWSSSLPGGTWKHTSTVTAPAGATGLESGFDTLTLLARNPNYQVIAGVSLASAGAEGDHAHPGDQLICSMIVLNVATDTSLTPDTGTPVVSLIRYNATANTLEALQNDGVTWSTWTTGGALPTIALTVNPNNSNLFQVTLTTSAWGATDIVAAQAQCKINGTPYGADAPREMVSSTANGHAKYKFDGLSIAGFGLK